MYAFWPCLEFQNDIVEPDFAVFNRSHICCLKYFLIAFVLWLVKCSLKIHQKDFTDSTFSCVAMGIICIYPLQYILGCETHLIQFHWSSMY